MKTVGITWFIAIACVAACGATTVPVHRDMTNAIIGRCLFGGAAGHYSLGTRGPFTVLVRHGDQTLWRGSGKEQQQLDIPVADLVAKAGGPVEIDVFAGDFPAGQDLPPKSDSALAKQIASLGTAAPSITAGRNGNGVPSCVPTGDGCVPDNCPPPPPDPLPNP